MILWQIYAILAICFIILEIFTPSMFFLNFALAATIVAGVSLVYSNVTGLIILFCIWSFLSFAFLRPILVKKFVKNKETGINCKYIGQKAVVEEEVTSNKGVISIYGERWEARTEDGSAITQGRQVEIIKNESIIMYVKEIVE